MRQFCALAIGMALLLPAHVCAADQSAGRAFPVGDATLLRLNVSGPVHAIAVAGSRTVTLHVETGGGSTTPQLQVTSSRTGRRLNLSITGPSQSVVPFAAGPAYELVISYPADLQLDMREFDGRVHVESVTAPAQIYDASGNIIVDQARASLTAEADSGDISVAAAQTTIELTVGNGNVEARLSPRWNGKLVRLEASNGNLDLHVPRGFRAHFDLSSGAGTVSNPLRSEPAGPLVFALAERGNVSIDTL